MKFVAIDPGKNGAIVALDYDLNRGHYLKLSYDKNGVIEYEMVIKLLNEYQPKRIYLEKVQGRGGWGASQTFNFGSYFGQLKLILSQVNHPHQLVTPLTWQRVIHDGIDKTLKPKERSLVAFKNLLPTVSVDFGKRKPHDGIMDALLILVWAYDKYGRLPGDWVIDEFKE